MFNVLYCPGLPYAVWSPPVRVVGTPHPTCQLQPGLVQASQAGVWQCEISLPFCQSSAHLPSSPSADRHTHRVLCNPTTAFTPCAQDKDDESVPSSGKQKNDSMHAHRAVATSLLNKLWIQGTDSVLTFNPNKRHINTLYQFMGLNYW